MERQRHLDELLTTLKQRLVRMSALTEIMIADAVKMLMTRDAGVMESVERNEHQVNMLQVEIDEMCLNIIALHQPTAGDLRFIIGAAKTNAELERLADQAVNVCQKARRLVYAPAIKPVDVLPRMAELAAGMVKDSLHAFVNRDPQKARAVLQRDDQLDDLKKAVTEDLLALMKADAGMAESALTVALAARNLERIGDHATNIAENAIFVVEGRDIRHHLGDDAPPATV